MALIGSLTTGVSCLDAFQQGMDVIGNNIANVNTTAFKGSTVDYANNFSDLLQASSPATSTTSNVDAMQIGTGVQIAAINVDYGEGTITSTGGTSDMAIAGNGYFSVYDPSSGNTYATRAGDFSVDSNENLVTATGQFVQGANNGQPSVTASIVNGALTYTVTPSAAASTVGNLQIGFNPGAPTTDGTITLGTTTDPATGDVITQAYLDAHAPSMSSYAVDSSGNINITLSNGTSYTSGSVLLQNFTDPEALESVGNNCYTNQAAAGPTGGTTALSVANNTAGTNGLGTVVGQSLESSNVDLSAQMTDLITAQRSFEAGSKIITTSDTMLQTIVNLKQ